jgi:predicted GNAT family N-acyltransferase
MRILIDTNLFIPLEGASPELDKGLADLVRLAGEFGHQILLHPASIQDLERDHDSARKAANLAKTKKYGILESPPEPTPAELVSLKLSESKDNDRVDNRILFAIYRDAANILVTEDIGIHRKAARLGLSARVHYAQQAVESLDRVYGRRSVAVPHIDEVPLHSIDVSRPFFDSLRGRYDFDRWFKDSARKGRKAWVYKASGGELGAICIYKEEQDEVVTDDGKRLNGRALKLCTFKVGETVRGRKVGELLLKAAFRYATSNQIEHVYLTMGADQPYLQALCEDFGFQHLGLGKGDEVYVKNHPQRPPATAGLSALEYHVRFFPHLSANGVDKYLIPIKPGYHELLFPDHPLNQAQLDLFAAGNAIKLAYLCHSAIKDIKPGDVLLFYRSDDVKGITSIGVVEFAAHISDAEKIVQLVSKRTVYPISEIRKMAKKPTKVLLFRLAAHLAEPVGREALAAGGGVKGNIQSIRRMTDGCFEWLVEQAKLGNCLLAN